MPQGQPYQPQQPQPMPQGHPYPQGQPGPAQGQPVPATGARPQPVRPGQAGAARPMPVKRKPGEAPVHAREGEEEEEEISTVALKNSPPWLISAVFHMIVLIILGLWVVAQLPKRQIELSAVYAEKLGEQLEFDSPLAGNDTELVEEPVLTPDDLPMVEDPFAAPEEMEIELDGHTATSKVEANQIGLALSGREEGTKKGLLAAYGGTATTEKAVDMGLAWLSRNQNKDGSWSLTGPYKTGAAEENQQAATAMALLAFQGAGNTHTKGKYKRNVAHGWKWLLKEQDANGNFFHEGPFHHRFYTQGQCTIAICELFGMTKDPEYRQPAERAVDYCLRGQSSEGGWRYSPNSDSDVSVTGWIVMALQSARMADMEVPEDNLRRITRYLDKVALDGGTRYPYQKGKEATRVMTAEAMLCRQYLGWKRDDERLIDAVEWITSDQNLIDFNHKRNVYYWYYATQVVHHMEGEYWKRWNNVMRQVLPEQQEKSGSERGSWNPLRPTRDQWEAHGGRLYVTCLSIYMLEVYYRHLPIYRKIYGLGGIRN
jgi:prenyltransferase beta subunit